MFNLSPILCPCCPHCCQSPPPARDPRRRRRRRRRRHRAQIRPWARPNCGKSSPAEVRRARSTTPGSPLQPEK